MILAWLCRFNHGTFSMQCHGKTFIIMHNLASIEK